MGFYGELKRRNVVRVAIAYVVASWLLVQGADLVLDLLGAPEVILRTVAAPLALGFIPAVIFAWAFEITPDGIKREADVQRDDSITHVTAKKLDYVTIGLLITVIVLFAVERMLPGQPHSSQPGSAPAEQAQAEVTAPEEAQPDAADEIPAKSIAVLPFANRSNQADDMFFTDGIHDDLLTQLSKIHDLKVISRTSVMEYRDTNKNMRQIGQELGVAHLLEGGVQRVGNRVRINMQLIEAGTDQHLWAETYDRELTAENIFDLQSEITREIVNAISIELTPEEQESLNEVPTQNLAAYESYLQARNLFYSANYSRQQELDARPLLERAVALDPNYVEAIALLSVIYGQLYWRGVDTSAALLQTYRQTIDRALEINPNSPAALRAAANWDYRIKNDYEASRALLERAIRRLPGKADLHGDLGLTLRRLGKWEEAVASFKRSLELDPSNRFYRALMTETLEGFFQYERVLDNTVPLRDADRDDLDIQLTRARAEFALTGRLEPLERALETMNLSPTNSYTILAYLTPHYRRDYEKVLAVLDSELYQAANDSAWFFAQTHFRKGMAYHLLGESEQATQSFEAAVDLKDEILASSLQPRAYGGLVIARALSFLERHEEAVELATMITTEYPYERDALVFGSLLTNQAFVRAMAGDLDGAFADLERSLTIPSAFVYTAWDLYYEPTWDFIRDDPRFQALASPGFPIQDSSP